MCVRSELKHTWKEPIAKRQRRILQMPRSSRDSFPPPFYFPWCKSWVVLDRRHNRKICCRIWSCSRRRLEAGFSAIGSSGRGAISLMGLGRSSCRIRRICLSHLRAKWKETDACTRSRRRSSSRWRVRAHSKSCRETMAANCRSSSLRTTGMRVTLVSAIRYTTARSDSQE